MICPSCGAEKTSSIDRCRACGALPDEGAPAVTMIPEAAPGETPLPPPRTAFTSSASDAFALAGSTMAGGTLAGGDAPVTGLPGGPDAPRSHASATFEPGQAFGPRYRIVRLLGVGGMGAVYQARDSELAVDVALKVIRPEVAADPVAARDLQQRFKRELLLARQVTHRNVVRIHDLGEVDGVKYISMPFVEGQDLATVLRKEGRLPVPRALRILRSMLSGMVAAHQAGVVHRDLKPANVMITAEDEALIMDFGVARLAEPADAGAESSAKASVGGVAGATAFLRESLAADGRTKAGTVVGTIEYMAPEQANGLPVDERADVYAIGMICHEMLSGPRRFATTTDAIADLMTRMRTPPAQLRTVNEEVPEAVEALVAKCLRPDAEERFRTSAELSANLDALDENGVPRPVPPKFYRTARFWAATAALVASVAGAAWWAAVRLTPPQVAEEKAPISILIADFANQTGEAVFDGLLEQTVGVGLEAATFVSAYQRPAALRVARQIKAGDRLDEQTGRLVAMREGIKIVLAGRIAKQGRGYAISARGIDPTTGNQVFATAVEAANRESVLRAGGRLTVELRSALGDTKPVEPRETWSAGSLEAVAAYTRAQEAFGAGRDAEAIEAYREATERDPAFARAYGGWATAATRLGRREEADRLWKIALARLDQMTDRERYRLLGAYYTLVTRNYDKAIETYETLVREYPADGAGHNNLAVGYFRKLDFKRALAEGGRLLEIYATSPLYRTNYALYAMYAGDFEAAAGQAQKLVDESAASYDAYLPIAMAALARGDRDAARQAYETMAASGAPGRSLAPIGLADLALVEGRPRQAAAILRQGIASDEKDENQAGVTAKRVVLAEALALQGETAAAAAAIKQALAHDQGPSVAVPAARILLSARKEREVTALGAALDNQLDRQSRAYGRLLAGLIARDRKRLVEAIEALQEGLKLADVWLVRFNLGVAFLEAGYHAEALSEFEACQKRRGEASAVFLNDEPTARYLAPLEYWIGRSKEGLGLLPQAQENYRAFVASRAPDSPDPLLGDARRRLGVR